MSAKSWLLCDYGLETFELRSRPTAEAIDPAALTDLAGEPDAGAAT